MIYIRKKPLLDLHRKVWHLDNVKEKTEARIPIGAYKNNLRKKTLISFSAQTHSFPQIAKLKYSCGPSLTHGYLMSPVKMR